LFQGFQLISRSLISIWKLATLALHIFVYQYYEDGHTFEEVINLHMQTEPEKE
jgi:hypothetical protein